MAPVRAVYPHSFVADPDPDPAVLHNADWDLAAFFNADPDPDLQKFFKKYLMKRFLE